MLSHGNRIGLLTEWKDNSTGLQRQYGTTSTGYRFSALRSAPACFITSAFHSEPRRVIVNQSFAFRRRDCINKLCDGHLAPVTRPCALLYMSNVVVCVCVCILLAVISRQEDFCLQPIGNIADSCIGHRKSCYSLSLAV